MITVMDSKGLRELRKLANSIYNSAGRQDFYNVLAFETGYTAAVLDAENDGDFYTKLNEKKSSGLWALELTQDDLNNVFRSQQEENNYIEIRNLLKQKDKIENRLRELSV